MGRRAASRGTEARTANESRERGGWVASAGVCFGFCPCRPLIPRAIPRPARPAGAGTLSGARASEWGRGLGRGTVHTAPRVQRDPPCFLSSTACPPPKSRPAARTSPPTAVDGHAACPPGGAARRCARQPPVKRGSNSPLPFFSINEKRDRRAYLDHAGAGGAEGRGHGC